MDFPRLFIQRPVLAVVVNVLLLLGGLAALMDLDLRQYPKLDNTVISVSTSYPGASADLVQGFITQPIQQAIASAEGIDYITSSSGPGSSSIQARLVLNHDAVSALTDIMSKVQQVKYKLPAGANDPIIAKTTGDSTAIAYLSFASSRMSVPQMSEYVAREVQPRLSTIPGVAQAQLSGDQPFAMRIWLDPDRMAAVGVTPTEVRQAILSNNYQTAAGQTKGYYLQLPITADTELHTAEEFGNTVIKVEGDTLIRLEDVAEVELGTESADSFVTADGTPAVFVGIQPTPSANPLDVVAGVKAALPEIARDLPQDMRADLVYDQTIFIAASIDEVIHTIAEAALIVVVVIFLFLASLRAVVIPIVTIPLSLIGVCVILSLLGFSLNLLTLLAMVLAIGLVVDDAILVVENIHRYIEQGLKPVDAAIKGATEIAGPVISMTITLAAVYAPIGLMGGLTGTLFKEFVFTLAGAVLISGFIALTLSPMMSSRILRAHPGRFARKVDSFFLWLRGRYRRVLSGVLDFRPLVVVFALFTMLSCFYLYTTARNELAPQEDQGAVLVQVSAPQSTNIDYMTAFTDELATMMADLPGREHTFIINGAGGPNSAFGGITLVDWSKREVTQQEVQALLQQRFAKLTGVQAFAFGMPPLPGASGLPVQFVVTTSRGYDQIFEGMSHLVGAAWQSGLFGYVDSSLKFDNPQLVVKVDRNLAADLGIHMSDIGDALQTMLGGNFISWFSIDDRSYQVIPQVPRRYRMNPEELGRIQVKTVRGDLVPLSAIISTEIQVAPNQLAQLNQLNSATLQAALAPGVTLGQALAFLEEKGHEVFGAGYTFNYEGESRQYVEEGDKLVFAFLFALVIIFLVLAAQFESFRDPLIILVTVPMSICGALVFINLGVSTINIYTQVGLVTMIGLISKHGILMVEFANQLREKEGVELREAIEQAASIRLRPILMTTSAMVVGVLPLLYATGAGSASRFDIGMVIASGLIVGTTFTLFVVPAVYTYLAHKGAPATEAKPAPAPAAAGDGKA